MSSGVTDSSQDDKGNYAAVADRVQFLEQIQRLLASRCLHGSESLCRLLRYLADQTLEHSGTSPKEYQIATEVFRRPKDFDPHLDSMVRVQVGRLRTKLEEYYSSEGAHDEVVVDVPRGTYRLIFHRRGQRAKENNKPGSHDSSLETESASRTLHKWSTASILFSLLLSAALTITADRLLMRRTAAAQLRKENTNTLTAIGVFWKGFLTGQQGPLVVFSNAAFVGRPDSGMRYYDSNRDSRARSLDYYTGVGEVLGVHALDKLFGQLHRSLRVKRGSLFSLDDAKNNDLIFIGSPSENLTLLDVPGTQDFIFQRITSGVSEGAMKIINVHPQAREAKDFLATPAMYPLVDDYSVIALKRGLDSAYSVMILAGETTIGTQGAVEFVCQQDSLQELLHRLSVSTPGELKPFEAVIHVKVARGVPIGTELVALRKTAY